MWSQKPVSSKTYYSLTRSKFYEQKSYCLYNTTYKLHINPISGWERGMAMPWQGMRQQMWQGRSMGRGKSAARELGKGGGTARARRGHGEGTARARRGRVAAVQGV